MRTTECIVTKPVENWLTHCVDCGAEIPTDGAALCPTCQFIAVEDVEYYDSGFVGIYREVNA